MSDQANLRVLVVDDDELALATISHVLTAAGCTVFPLATAIGVTQFVLSHDIDVVILDLQMPALRGDRLASMLRGNKRLKDVPVVIVSAAPDHELNAICSKIPGVVPLSKKRMQRELAELVHQQALTKYGTLEADASASEPPRGVSIPPEQTMVIPALPGSRASSSLNTDFVSSLPQQLVRLTRVWREASLGDGPAQLEFLSVLQELKRDCLMFGFTAFSDVLGATEELVKSLRSNTRVFGSASVAVLGALNALARMVREGSNGGQSDTAQVVARLNSERVRLSEPPAANTATRSLVRKRTGEAR
jgi:CheY-like chemotaxis protein